MIVRPNHQQRELINFGIIATWIMFSGLFYFGLGVPYLQGHLETSIIASGGLVALSLFLVKMLLHNVDDLFRM